jgi:DNA polymerase III subunit epsilon
VLNLARKLLAAGAAPEPENGTGESVNEPETRAWDAPRVARHVERALAQAYRAYRRAHWLLLLHDSDVVYREPGASTSRVLEVRGGEVVRARDLAGQHALFERVRPALLERRIAFDRAKYERLRVLTTELKRIVRDGGSVSLQWGPARRLPEHWLPGALGSS